MLQRCPPTCSYINVSSLARSVCQAIPVLGPMFNKGNSWQQAFEQAGRQLAGLSSSAAVMFLNNLYGINLMNVNPVAATALMVLMMEVGDKGGRFLYNIVLETSRYIIDSIILGKDPELTNCIKQYGFDVINFKMEPFMLTGAVIGMWLGMKAMLIKPDSTSDAINALIKTTNMEIGMLPGMTFSMLVAHKTMGYLQRRLEDARDNRIPDFNQLTFMPYQALLGSNVPN